MWSNIRTPTVPWVFVGKTIGSFKADLMATAHETGHPMGPGSLDGMVDPKTRALVPTNKNAPWLDEL